jgi:hypothetical protein
MINTNSTKFKVAMWVSLIGAFVFMFSILPDLLSKIGLQKIAESNFITQASQLADVIYPYVVPGVLVTVGLVLFAIPVMKLIGFGMLTIGFLLILGVYLSRIK